MSPNWSRWKVFTNKWKLVKKANGPSEIERSKNSFMNCRLMKGNIVSMCRTDFNIIVSNLRKQHAYQHLFLFLFWLLCFNCLLFTLRLLYIPHTYWLRNVLLIRLNQLNERRNSNKSKRENKTKNKHRNNLQRRWLDILGKHWFVPFYNWMQIQDNDHVLRGMKCKLVDVMHCFMSQSEVASN